MAERALLREKRILGMKLETTVGTPISLAAADATYNVFDATIDPDFTFEGRMSQGGFAPLGGVQSYQCGTLKFKTELYGGASLPAWATTMLASCGVGAASGLIVAPSCAMPAASGIVRSVTAGLWEDGVLKTIYGAMGNVVMTFPAAKKCILEWTYKGIWAAVTDVALPTPTYVTVAPLLFNSSGLSIAGTWSPRVGELSIDLGNDIQMHEDSTTTSGLLSAYIASRTTKGKFNPDASRVADANDTYGQMKAGTLQSFAMSLGGSGNGVAFAAPKMQFTKVTESDRNKLQTDDIEFQFCRSAATDDDFSMTFQ